MLEKLKKIVPIFGTIKHRVNEADNKIEQAAEIIKEDTKAVAEAVKDEIQEVKDLNLTEADKLLGDTIATVATTVMTTYGIPCSDVQKQIISKAAAYAIRDFKEGCTNPDKLIVMRVCNKLHEEREARLAARRNK